MKLARITLAACAMSLVHHDAFGQMIPISDDRKIETNLRYDGRSAHDEKNPPGAFATWFEFSGVTLTGTTGGGGGFVNANQSAFFDPASITFSGGSSGTWSVYSAEHYDAKSHLRWTVRMNQCFEYMLHMTVDPGTPVNAAYIDVSGPGGSLFHLVSGTVDSTGRLPSGDYVFEADVPLSGTFERGYGGTHNLIWQCATCTSSLISVQPVDPIVRCDTVATICVVPNGPGSFTYQWRRNYVPLTNTAHYSGVTTPCLSIQHACYADNGYFDVVVKSGAISEASRGAHVGISSIPVGVPPASIVAWSLGLAVPSPSRNASAFHYAAPAPFRARATIHDASGRVVSQLADRIFEASGTLVWDGRTAAGARALPGIYFLRFERDGAVDVRRIVRVR